MFPLACLLVQKDKNKNKSVSLYIIYVLQIHKRRVRLFVINTTRNQKKNHYLSLIDILYSIGPMKVIISSIGYFIQLFCTHQTFYELYFNASSYVLFSLIIIRLYISPLCFDIWIEIKRLAHRQKPGVDVNVLIKTIS